MPREGVPNSLLLVGKSRVILTSVRICFSPVFLLLQKKSFRFPPVDPLFAPYKGNDQRLYEFIVRHFLACCSEDAKGQETMVEIEISNERFVAHGLMVLARNYLEVYPYEKWSDKVGTLLRRGCSILTEGENYSFIVPI